MQRVAISRVRGIAFDLWNTLAYNDHRPNPIIALAREFGVYGQPGWTKILERGMMRKRMTGIEEAIASLSDLTGVSLAGERREELRRLWTASGRHTRIFEEVPEALRRLARGHRLGLLSNTQSFDLEFLDQEGISECFRARVLSCDMGILKPDPAIFLRLAERLQLAPSQILMVGDNLRDDILAAEAVGMPAVLIRRHQAPLSFQERHPVRKPISDLRTLCEILGV